MLRRRPDAETPAPARSGRGWSTRLAWLTLVGGVVMVGMRVGVATVVQIHGDGMAPTLLDGDHVMLVRGSMGVSRGDVVVYVPGAASPRLGEEPGLAEADDPRADNGNGEELPDVREAPDRDLRNTAVIDPEELEDNWEKVQARSGGLATYEAPTLRVGRVLAVPGDRVAFHVPGAALGLAIDGQPLLQKTAEPLRLSLRDADDPEGPVGPPRMRSTAYESPDDRRYQVLVPAEEPRDPWPALELPPEEAGPVELEAPGYLVVADNREDGACCDSRAVGWVPAEAIRGRVLVRLTGDASAAPDLDPSARGLQWKP
ncbi:S26 family signal peptidase [Paraliomyxa miuraensis]|uniref:S26 family signal peptidase n=1 Tax=Paraliomyxa miuraensis TaxID=376150 RepID=UPI00225ADC84|nr:S26 family signal peptidase [Paraliomyxa miuraensis]MCX4245618.1 S26 family signal peptidase [Paraliomyxa miuraensis]